MTEPTDEIRAAAAKLRALIANVPAPPWSPGGIGDYGWTVHCGDLATDRAAISLDTQMDNEQGKALTRYIAAMHPGIGAALAAWLDFEADLLDMAPHIAVQPRTERALATARLINQEHP